MTTIPMLTLSAARMRENLDVTGFELSERDLAQLAGLDRGPEGRTGADPDTFDYRPS